MSPGGSGSPTPAGQAAGNPSTTHLRRLTGRRRGKRSFRTLLRFQGGFTSEGRAPERPYELRQQVKPSQNTSWHGAPRGCKTAAQGTRAAPLPQPRSLRGTHPVTYLGAPSAAPSRRYLGAQGCTPLPTAALRQGTGREPLPCPPNGEPAGSARRGHRHLQTAAPARCLARRARAPPLATAPPGRACAGDQRPLRSKVNGQLGGAARSNRAGDR